MHSLCRHVVIAAAVLLASAQVPARDGWPVVALPPDVERFDIAREMSVNGAPMRVQGFVSSASRSDVAAWFRRSLGQPLVENDLQGKRILGRLEGDHYVTVQLEALDPRHQGGTRGLVAITDVKAGGEHRRTTVAVARQWLARMPADSKLLNHVESNDGSKVSSHLLFSNRHAPELNVERVRSLMTHDGYTLERGSPASPDTGGGSHDLSDGRTLYFKAPSKEAIAVIARDGQGETVIVLNTIRHSERAR